MMSTPIPTIITPKEPNTTNFQNKKTFKLNINNINYDLILSYNEKLISFEIEKENEFPKKDYNLYLDLEQLIKIDKYFSQFESLSEIPSSFEALIEMKKLDLIKEEKEMKIRIINPLNKKELYINIPLKEKSLKSEVDSLIPYIKSLHEKIDKMENRITLLENKVNELYIIKDELQKFKKKEKEQKEKEKEKEQNEIKEKDNRLFPESNIIKKEDEKIILSWLDQKPLKFSLLLDTQKDGDSISTFYQKCEKKAPTILFFKTTKGARFGGYTTQIWPTRGKSKDEKSFLFSLNKKEKYKVNEPERAIFGWGKYFQFGTCCFRIYDKCTLTDNNYINDNKRYYNVPDNYGLTDGEKKFVISSYEVYHIEF